MIIDTHSHLQFDAYDVDRDEVIKRTLQADIACINVGCSLASSKAGVELAEKHTDFYAAIGLHPTDVDEEFDASHYYQLAQSKKVVAIGEIGLDYFRPPFDKEKQKEIFIKQLDLAKELNLPVILHCRMAHDDVIEILGQQHANRGVVHCFTGTWEQAQKYMDLGFYIGLNGIMFKFNIDETVKNLPLDKIVVETDAPFLTPPMAESNPPSHEASARQRRNEPLFIKHTIARIAQLKGMSFEEVAEASTQNAKKLFNM